MDQPDPDARDAARSRKDRIRNARPHDRRVVRTLRPPDEPGGGHRRAGPPRRTPDPERAARHDRLLRLREPLPRRDERRDLLPASERRRRRRERRPGRPDLDRRRRRRRRTDPEPERGDPPRRVYPLRRAELAPDRAASLPDEGDDRRPDRRGEHEARDRDPARLMDDQAARYRSLLVEAVAAAGPEIPVLLSGGVDSSTVLAAALLLGARPATFTFALEGPPSPDARAARAIAERFELPHELVLIPRDGERAIADVRRVVAISGNA